MAEATKNFLSFKHKIEVTKWIEKNLADIKSKKPLIQTSARQCAEKLGFAVTEHNLRYLFKQLDLGPWPADPRSQDKRQYSTRITELERRADRMNEAIESVVHRLDAIEQKLKEHLGI